MISGFRVEGSGLRFMMRVTGTIAWDISIHATPPGLSKYGFGAQAFKV